MKQTIKYLVSGCFIYASVLSHAAFGQQEHQHDEQHHQDLRQVSGQSQDEHDEHDAPEEQGGHEGHDEEAEGVSHSSDQIALAGIKVATLMPRSMDYEVYAPGEIRANGYTSYIVSPRVDSVVVRRHVALGDNVEKGQALVTLFSEDVAQAQATFLVADSEWRRVKQLGRKAVGDKRFITAQADGEAAFARLWAFGLSEAAIRSPKGSALAPQSSESIAALDPSRPVFGEYTLTATNAGVVLSDDFHQGQRVVSGEALMELADEHELWVEARLAPSAQLQLPTGSPATVRAGNNRFVARVTQEAHTIDPQTRTRVVRLSVTNEAHRLHPGMFVDVNFRFTTEDPVVAVPESALIRSADGDWAVFVESESGLFKAHEVALGRSFGQWREIKGVQSGTRVVMEGAFFVASQIAKGGFVPHNH